LGKDFSFENIIALDIGGTTAKAGIITGGTPRVTTEFCADAVRHGAPTGGYAIKSPVIDLVEIGAGGGSIAWVDKAGIVKVGPYSAGALPGPACYGLGGTEPTVTDASLLVGFLNPDYFHGGRTRLHPELAARVIHDKIGRGFGWSTEKAAAAIIRIATANMIEMVRLISVRRGYDPRDFCLVAYGGAGPLYAGLIARELNIPLIIIPPLAGLFSALGVLVAGIRHDLAITHPYLTDEMPPMAGISIFQDLETRMVDLLDKEDPASAEATMHRSVDVRYLGQVFELNVPLEGNLNGGDALRDLEGQFERKYRETYHYVLPGSRIEIVNFRLSATIEGTALDKVAFAQEPTQTAEAAQPALRKIYDDQRGRILEVPVFRDASMRSRQEIEGPAMIEKEDTTILILEGQRCELDERGCVLIRSG
jgi:N-methylhydantoinase A